MLSLVLSYAGRYYRCEGAVLPLERYCRYTGAVLPLMWLSGTTAHHHGTTAEGRGQGVKSWAGVVSSTPYPFASSPGSSSSLSSAISPREGPAALRLRTVPLHSLRWNRSPPRPLPMDASIAPVPLLFVSSFQILRFRGNSSCISRFLAKSRLE